MLQEQMRCLLLLLWIVPILGHAQVVLDREIRLMGDPGERVIDGVASPTWPTSAITVGTSVLGIAHWTDAVVNANTIELSSDVPIDAYRPGMLLRFLCPNDLSGALQLGTSGLADLPLLRSDGAAPIPGHLRAGSVIEVVNAVDRWIILAPVEKGCPPGSVAIHDGLCIDVAPSANMIIYNATDHCNAKGGKLCTWDEFHLGCTLNGPQLTGLFTEWEWIDDTSNHSHTADQAGRYNCKSQRSANPVINQGKARCCYHPR